MTDLVLLIVLPAEAWLLLWLGWPSDGRNRGAHGVRVSAVGGKGAVCPHSSHGDEVGAASVTGFVV